MPYLEESGHFQLKPVAWAKHTYPDGNTGLKFDFVNKDGLQVNGTFSWTKKDGSVNDSIQIFSDAFESQKSVLCEVQQGKEKQNGGHFYSVKWAVTSKSDSVMSKSSADLKTFLKQQSERKPVEVIDNDSAEMPF